MSMSSSVRATEWKPQDSTGKRSQGEMPFFGEVEAMQELAQSYLAQSTFTGCLISACHHSGMNDHEIADAIPISHGYMSKFMRSVGQQWAKRLVKFMRVTRSLAPLQWIAHQMGCDVVVRHNVEAELLATRARLVALEKQYGRSAA